MRDVGVRYVQREPGVKTQRLKKAAAEEDSAPA